VNQAFELERVERPDGIILLRVRGRLDAVSAPRFMEECNSIQSTGKHLVINLSHVPFIASAGVGAIMAVADSYHEAGVSSVRLASLSKAVSMVVDLLSLHEFLQVDASEDESCTSLKKAA